MTTLPEHVTRPWSSGEGLVLLAVLLAVLAVLAGCGGDGSNAAGECDDPDALPKSETANVPTDMDLTEFGTLTELENDGELTTFRIVAEGSMEDLVIPVTRQLRRDGWDIVGSEDEGVEAEVFVSKGTGDTGVVRLEKLDCSGSIGMEGTINRPTTPRPSGTTG